MEIEDFFYDEEGEAENLKEARKLKGKSKILWLSWNSRISFKNE